MRKPISAMSMAELLLHNENRLCDAEGLLLSIAQDLREYADAAKEAGENIQATDELLADVDVYFGFSDNPPNPTNQPTKCH